MKLLGWVLSLPLTALAILISVAPVWLAAKVVGTGRQETWRVAFATLLATALGFAALILSLGWGLLLAPLLVILIYSRMLDTSPIRAFILCLLAAAFQVCFAKLIGGFSAG